MEEKPGGNKKDERIEDTTLAEGMAYAEKPYRDTSLERAQARKEGLEYYSSDEFREKRIAELNQEFQETLATLNELSDPERLKCLEDIFELYGRDAVTTGKISDEKMSDWIHAPLKFRTSPEEVARSKEWIEGPIPTGIQKAEDFKRTYERRARSGRLSEAEALKEAVYIREKAREGAELLMQYHMLSMDWNRELDIIDKSWDEILKMDRSTWSWEKLKKFNDIRNFLKSPIDTHIKAEDYEEALEYIERLQEDGSSSFVSWLRSRLVLKALALKDFIRRKGPLDGHS
jgi:hypothetical protein